jgi:hypothetical protein
VRVSLRCRTVAFGRGSRAAVLGCQIRPLAAGRSPCRGAHVERSSIIAAWTLARSPSDHNQPNASAPRAMANAPWWVAQGSSRWGLSTIPSAVSRSSSGQAIIERTDTVNDWRGGAQGSSRPSPAYPPSFPLGYALLCPPRPLRPQHPRSARPSRLSVHHDRAVSKTVLSGHRSCWGRSRPGPI